VSAIFRPYDHDRSDRSARDRARHREKIRDSIRDNISDILSEESIIGKDKDKIIKVPIKSIKEYRFIYGDNSPGVAQGNGKSKTGDVVGKGDPGQPDASGQAGDSPGVDAIETDITLEELIDIMFEDLELPELQRKALKQIETSEAKRKHGSKKKGIRARLDKRKTAINRIKRKRSKEEHEEGKDQERKDRFPFHQDDMRYYRVTHGNSKKVFS